MIRLYKHFLQNNGVYHLLFITHHPSLSPIAVAYCCCLILVMAIGDGSEKWWWVIVVGDSGR